MTHSYVVIVLSYLTFPFIITLSSTINDFTFYNTGTVYRNETYGLKVITNVYNEGYQYFSEGENSWFSNQLSYLFKILDNGSVLTPPSGMRSAIPLGSLGGGTFEIRGDGRLTDWTIFNNGPYDEPSNFSKKYDLNNAIFGIMINNNNNKDARIIQTHPNPDTNLSQYAIEQITYSGSYPVSQLNIYDSIWSQKYNFNIEMNAFGTFEPLNSNISSYPSVIFWINLINNGNQDITIDFLFNLPDIINVNTINKYANNGISINKYDPFSSQSGNITMCTYECNMNDSTCNQPLNGDFIESDTVTENWYKFINESSINKNKATKLEYRNIGWIVRDIEILSHTTKSIGFIFSWYFPNKTFNTFDKSYYNVSLGQYYSHFFSSSNDVNKAIISDRFIPNIINNIVSWHSFWKYSSSNMYSNSLKDTFINSPSFIARTSMYFYNFFRQFESFSCIQVEPPFEHWYRSLAYNFIFGNVLDRSVIELFIKGMGADGMVSELYGGGCYNMQPNNQSIDYPEGGPRSDNNNVVVMNMYLTWQWYKDGNKYLIKNYNSTKLIQNWAIQQSINNHFGLPYRLLNWDEHGIIGDIDSYSAFIYLTSLNAMKTMAIFMNDTQYINKTLNIALKYAYGNISKHLWNNQKQFYRSFWCKNGYYPYNGLQGEVLYGYLWSFVLGININISNNNIQQHIINEQLNNLSPYGIQFMTGRNTTSYNCGNDTYHSSFKDRDTWEAFAYDHASLAIFSGLNVDKYGLNVANIESKKYQYLYNDQWDYRDVSSTYNDSSNEQSRPTCNSHYTRQLNIYALMLALNKQRYIANDINKGVVLYINPVKPIIINQCLPIMIPQSMFLLCRVNNTCYNVVGKFGNITIHYFNIFQNVTVTGLTIQPNVNSSFCT